MDGKKKEKSVDDVFREAISGADSKPRGKWVLARDLTAEAAPAADPPPLAGGPPRKNNGTSSSIWSTIATGVTVAAGVALVAAELWNIAYPDPEPANGEREKKKMMKQPGNRPHYMPRDEFEANPRDYFRNLHHK